MKNGFDIRFIQPIEEIPTALRLVVNEKYVVVYRRTDCDVSGEFAYRFDVYYGDDNTDYDELVSAIVRKMESQSYDHGAQWRETSRERIDRGRQTSYVSIIVRFYTRDAG